MSLTQFNLGRGNRLRHNTGKESVSFVQCNVHILPRSKHAWTENCYLVTRPVKVCTIIPLNSGWQHKQMKSEMRRTQKSLMYCSDFQYSLWGYTISLQVQSNLWNLWSSSTFHSCFLWIISEHLCNSKNNVIIYVLYYYYKIYCKIHSAPQPLLRLYSLLSQLALRRLIKIMQNPTERK